MGAGRQAAASAWWEVRIPTSAETADAMTNFLWELGALGVVEEERPEAAPGLRAFFPGSAAPDELRARTEAYTESLVRLGFGAVGAATVVPVRDEAWAEAWRVHFRPVPVGRRLVVVPPWDAARGGDRLAVVIDPGRAFGTGHHGSTAGCLAALETVVERDRPAEALDLGTGSGILAIAAARLGVGRVHAVDDDPDAVAAARANARQNGVAARIDVEAADAGTLETPASALVLANLLSAAHRRLAGRYAALVRAGGALVLGGILDGEADAVRAVVRASGFAPVDTVSCDGWTTLVFRREARDATVHVHA